MCSFMCVGECVVLGVCGCDSVCTGVGVVGICRCACVWVCVRACGCVCVCMGLGVVVDLGLLL